MSSLRLYCPTPSKRRYALEGTATAAAVVRSGQSGIEMEPYHCACDEWHIRTVAKHRNTEERYQAKIARGQAGSTRPWLEWEDDLVMDDSIGTSALVEMLGRSRTAIQNRHAKLRGNANAQQD